MSRNSEMIKNFKLDILKTKAAQILANINKLMLEYEKIMDEISAIEGVPLKPEEPKTSWDGLLDDSDHQAIRSRMNSARRKLKDSSRI